MGSHHVDNWSEYNRSLINRGSLTLWISDDAIAKWLAPKSKGKNGRPHIYSDDAILCALMLRAYFHLTFRAVQGFITSIFLLLNIDLPVPSYTRICCRAKEIKFPKLSKKRPKDLVFDSTGLKVYGEGEWKVKVHGKSKRRTWRKFHIAIDPQSHELSLTELTTNSIADCEVMPKMMGKAPRSVKNAYADGAYDTAECRRAAKALGAKAIIPPARNAVLRETDEPAIAERNNFILEIAGLGGDENARKLWKKLRGYHRRSIVETAMFRFKRFFGGSLQSREMENQIAEINVKSLVMNKLTQVGMPKGRWVP